MNYIEKNPGTMGMMLGVALQWIGTIVAYWIHRTYFGTRYSFELCWVIPMAVVFLVYSVFVFLWNIRKFVYIPTSIIVFGLNQIISLILAVGLLGE